MKFEAFAMSSSPFVVVATVGVPHEGNLVAIVLPDCSAIFCVESDDERISLRVALEDHQIFPDDGRAGWAPLVRGNVVRAEVETSEIDFPQRLAVDVVSVQALRSEPCDDDATVSHGRRVRIRRLDVTFLARLAFVSDSFPEDLAVGLSSA
jgi:hypothetical protein